MIHWVEDTAGFDAGRLSEAIAFHRAHETTWPTTMFLPDGRYIGTASIGDRPEHAAVIGPVRPRGGPNGLILRGGRLVAEWGDTRRADMTFSISKSYLALLTGLALGDGLIPSLDDRVGGSVPGPWFADPHNATITWRHLLQLASEWGARFGASRTRSTTTGSWAATTSPTPASVHREIWTFPASTSSTTMCG